MVSEDVLGMIMFIVAKFLILVGVIINSNIVISLSLVLGWFGLAITILSIVDWLNTR